MTNEFIVALFGISVFFVIIVVYDLLTARVVTRLNDAHVNCVRDVSWHPRENRIISSSVWLLPYFIFDLISISYVRRFLRVWDFLPPIAFSLMA